MGADKRETWEDVQALPGKLRIGSKTYDLKEEEPEELDVETLKELLAVFAEQAHNPFAVERKLGLNCSTIYAYVNHDGTPTATGHKLLDDSKDGEC